MLRAAVPGRLLAWRGRVGYNGAGGSAPPEPHRVLGDTSVSAWGRNDIVTRAGTTRCLSWFDRLVEAAPWWLLGLEVSAVLPAYFWWLVTGDALTAKRILKAGVFFFLALLMVFGGGVFFALPFHGVARGRPSWLERAGYAAAGGVMWGVAVAVVADELLGWELLAAARAGTAAFFAASAFGLAVQRRLAAKEESRACREEAARDEAVAGR